MRKLLFYLIILITLITAFVAYMFYHEPSSDELVGRSVVLEFGPRMKFILANWVANLLYLILVSLTLNFLISLMPL